MKRSLLSVMALGAVVTLMGAAGVFAVFTDRATTGTNTISSGERAGAADLKIATATQAPGSAVTCQTFNDNLTTGLFSLSGIQPGDPSTSKTICLKNAGSSALSISTSAIDLVDTETGCTGDEQLSGDTTCGSGAGELSTVIRVEIAAGECATGYGSVGTHTLAYLSGSPVLTANLASGAETCVFFLVDYPTSTSATDVQKAQSDSVSWRFAFDGTTS